MIGREKPGEQSEVAQLIQQTLEQERWQREMMEQRYNQYMDEQEVSVHAQDSGSSAVESTARWKTAWFVFLLSVMMMSAHAHCRRKGAMHANQFYPYPLTLLLTCTHTHAMITVTVS